MLGIKNTCRHIVDYTLLASKSSNNKQNGSQKDETKLEMSVEAKYASPNTRKSNNRGENISDKSQELDRNMFGKFMASHNESESGKNKMVAMEHKSDDNEILLNKRVRKQIVGNIKDDRTGSMMPVVLEQMVDGTKSKRTGRKVNHMPSMAGDGANILDLSMENINNTEHNVVGKGKKTEPRGVRTKSRQPKFTLTSKLLLK